MGYYSLESDSQPNSIIGDFDFTVNMDRVPKLLENQLQMHGEWGELPSQMSKQALVFFLYHNRAERNQNKYEHLSLDHLQPIRPNSILTCVLNLKPEPIRLPKSPDRIICSSLPSTIKWPLRPTIFITHIQIEGFQLTKTSPKWHTAFVEIWCTHLFVMEQQAGVPQKNCCFWNSLSQMVGGAEAPRKRIAEFNQHRFISGKKNGQTNLRGGSTLEGGSRGYLWSEKPSQPYTYCPTATGDGAPPFLAYQQWIKLGTVPNKTILRMALTFFWIVTPNKCWSFPTPEKHIRIAPSSIPTLPLGIWERFWAVCKLLIWMLWTPFLIFRSRQLKQRLSCLHTKQNYVKKEIKVLHTIQKKPFWFWSCFLAV